MRDGGPDAFYGGDIAKRIVAAAAAAGSPLAIEDFAEHTSDWMEPLRVAYRKGEAASFPPPAQGMSALMILGLADGFDVSALGPPSARPRMSSTSDNVLDVDSPFAHAQPVTSDKAGPEGGPSGAAGHD